MIKKTFDGNVVVFTETIDGDPTGEEMRFDLDRLSDDMKQTLMRHGASQKLGDAFSQEKGDFHSKLAASQRVYQNLLDGNWNGGGSGGLLAEALAAVTGKDLEEAIQLIGGMHQEKKKDLRAKPAIKAWITQRQAEIAARKAADADTSDLLAMFD